MTDAKVEFRELIGRPLGSENPAVAPDPVNQPMIRHWAHALGDMNPAYLDPEFAERSRFGGIVSPPAMLQTWVMPARVPVETTANPLDVIAEAGFTGIVATNSEFEIERYPRLGDAISATTVIEDVSDEKKTALGAGHFVTWVTTFVDQHGDVLGRQRLRVLRFKPGQ